ncbi:unnamed protein product [Amoebophrya sp. A25]|nr:unnamed protein product [Amoebophrya sp. A25]|eukprot:GSA25T00003344001.1
MPKLARPAAPGAGCGGGNEGLVATIDKNQHRTTKKTTQKTEFLYEAAAEYSTETGVDANHYGNRGATRMPQQRDKMATTADGPQGTKLAAVNILLVFLRAILQVGAGFRRLVQQCTSVLFLMVLHARVAFSDAGVALTLWASPCLPLFCEPASARQRRNTCLRSDVDARDENVGANRIMWMRATASWISISTIMLISASASILFLTTPSTWPLLGHCGLLLSVALSCTLMAVEVVLELMLLGCLQFLLVGAALCVGLVLAYELFEALQYAPPLRCPAWLGFRSNSVSGYTVHSRGSSGRNMRRWLRRFWVNTCDDLSHSLWSYRYRVRHWAWTRQWAQPLRGSAAAHCSVTEVLSARTSSSRLARWQKNSNTQQKDRRGGKQPHRNREGLALYHLLPESSSPGRRCFVASFCCFFGTMIADLELPSIAALATNNKQRQLRKAMQITSKAQFLEETEYYSEEAGLDTYTNHHGSRGLTSMLQQSDKVATTAEKQGVLEAVNGDSGKQVNEAQAETAEISEVGTAEDKATTIITADGAAVISAAPATTYGVKGDDKELAEIDMVTNLLATTPGTVALMSEYFETNKVSPSEIDSAEAMKAYTAREIWNSMQIHGGAIASAQIGGKEQGKARAKWKASSLGAAVTMNAWSLQQLLHVYRYKQGQQSQKLDTLELWSSSRATFKQNSKTPAAWKHVDVDVVEMTIAVGASCDGAMVSKSIHVLEFSFHDIPITLQDVEATFPDSEDFRKVKEFFDYVKDVVLNLKGERAIPGMIATAIAADKATRPNLGFPPFVARPWLQSDHLPLTMLAELPSVEGFDGRFIVELFNWNVLGRGVTNMAMPKITATLREDRPEEDIENVQSLFQLVALRKKLEQLSAHLLPKGLSDDFGAHLSVLAFQEDLFVHAISDSDAANQKIELVRGWWTRVIAAHGYEQAFDATKSWHNGLPPGAKREAFSKFSLDKSGGSVVAREFSPGKGASPVSVETPEFEKDANGKATQEFMMGNTVYIKFSDSFKASGCKPKVVQSGWNAKNHPMYPNAIIPFRSVAIAFVVCERDKTIVAAFPVAHLAGGKFDDNEIFNEVLKGHYVPANVRLGDPRKSPWGKNYAQMTDEQKKDLPPSAKGEEGFNLYYQGAGDLIRTMVKEFIRQVYVAADKIGLRYAKGIPIIMPMDMNAKPDMPFFFKHVFAAFPKELQSASMQVDEKSALVKAQEIAVQQLIPVPGPEQLRAESEGGSVSTVASSSAATAAQQQQEAGSCCE